MENSRRRKIALTEINAGKESQGKSQEPKGFPPTNDVGTTLQDLPSQLIMEIFSSLPMKTIFACSEQLRAVPEPSAFGPLEKQFIDQMRCGVLRGCLSISDFGECDHVDIWVMNEYGIKESWTKDFVIENLLFERHHLDRYVLVTILDSGELLMLFNDDSLVSYDRTEEVFNYLSLYGVGSKFQAIAHIPSFMSLRDVAEAENLKSLKHGNCARALLGRTRRESALLGRTRWESLS